MEDFREVRALLKCWALREEKKAVSKTQAAAQDQGVCKRVSCVCVRWVGVGRLGNVQRETCAYVCIHLDLQAHFMYTNHYACKQHNSSTHPITPSIHRPHTPTPYTHPIHPLYRHPPIPLPTDGGEQYLLSDTDSLDESLMPTHATTTWQHGQDGDVPEVLVQAQTKLWDCCVTWGTELSSLSAALRALVRTRYHAIHLDVIDPDRVSGNDVLQTPEDPGFASLLQENRQGAAASVARFADSMCGWVGGGVGGCCLLGC